MWWQFYSGLSIRMIDHCLQYVDASAPAPSADETLAASASPELQRMLKEISTQMDSITAQQKKALQAELATHARTMALSEISHDLRTPLNAIIGFTQMMESGIFGPIGNAQYSEYLRHIRESGYELLERIEELLDTEPDKSASSSLSNTPSLRELTA